MDSGGFRNCCRIYFNKSSLCMVGFLPLHQHHLAARAEARCLVSAVEVFSYRPFTVNLLPVRNPSRRWCLAGWWQDGIARLGRVPRLGFLGWIAVLILNNRRSRAEFPRPWLRVSLSAVIFLDLTLTQKL